MGWAWKHVTCPDPGWRCLVGVGWCLVDDCWVEQEKGLGHPVFWFHFQIPECLSTNDDNNTFINLVASPKLPSAFLLRLL